MVGYATAVPRRRLTLQRQIVQLEKLKRIGKNTPRLKGDSNALGEDRGTRLGKPRLANGFQKRPTLLTNRVYTRAPKRGLD
jgi:hypothetical protein